MMGFNPKSAAAMLENIVYFELRRKGYEVYIGKNETKEIDFVAVLRDELAAGNINGVKIVYLEEFLLSKNY